MCEGIVIGNEKIREVNDVMDSMEVKYTVTQNAIAVALGLRHPAGIQTIIGTTNLRRVRETVKADSVQLTREEWYELYLSAGRQLP